MTIREAEVRTGLDRATIRFYEKEGLFTPWRLENGYRDYSEADIATLLRIKLLRELGVTLEEIRSLQQGHTVLSDTLTHRIQMLEQERAANARARETCQAIRSEGVSYAQLDAEKYLCRIPADMDSPAVFQDAPPAAYCPWRRFFARTLDLQLYGLLWTAVLAWVFHVNITSRGALLNWIDALIAILLMLFIEPLLLRFWGTTPGKALFGLRLEHPDGSRITYGEGFSRTKAVIWRGLGLNIPIYAIYRGYKSYKEHGRDGEMSWDQEQDLAMDVRPGRIWRNLAFLGAWVAIVAVTVGMGLSAGFPPNRSGLTVAEFTENYNFLMDYYGQDTAYVLDADGTWTQRDPDAVIISISGQDGPPPALSYETDENGRLTAVTRTWDYDQDSFVVMWPGVEMQLLSLAFAAGEGNWFQYWGKLGLLDVVAEAGSFQNFERHQDGVELCCSVEQEGFSGGGNWLTAPEEAEEAWCRIRFTAAAD